MGNESSAGGKGAGNIHDGLMKPPPPTHTLGLHLSCESDEAEAPGPDSTLCSSANWLLTLHF